jgi:hypothetical protein
LVNDHTHDEEPEPFWLSALVWVTLVLTAPIWLAVMSAVWCKRKLAGEL